jgi:hypothetical protein
MLLSHDMKAHGTAHDIVDGTCRGSSIVRQLMERLIASKSAVLKPA